MLEWIISSAVLTAIVIVLRLILKGKMSLRLQYALWALVLLRLLVPVSFGSTVMSVQNVVARPAAQAPVTIDWEKYEAATPVEYNPELYPAVPSKEELDRYSLAELAEMYGYEILHVDTRSDDPSRSTVRVAQPLTVNEILNIVWTAGAGLIALWLLVTNLRFYFKLRKSRERLDVDGAPLPVYVTDRIDTPCLFGLIKPKIYVTPEVTQDAAVLRYSVAHEATHRRHDDHIWAILRGLCLAVHWFNPLVWIAAVLSRNDAELACDEATIRRIGEKHRADYGRTLIQLTCQKRPAIFVAATTMTGSGRTIKERIRLIVKKPKTAIITLIAIVLVIAIAVGCTFTGAKPDEETTDPTESGETTPSAGELDVSGIPALLDAIDLREATLSFQASTFPAEDAIHAAEYLESLKTQFSWMDNWEARPASADELGPFVQLAAPHATLTFYLNEMNETHIETETAEGWFYPVTAKYEPDGSTSVYNKMLSWYIEAEAASLYGGNTRILSEEEIDAFRALTASAYETRDDETGMTALHTREISCFFTSHYTNVRNIDAYKFLRYFPEDPNAPAVDEAEWALVQEVEDWRFGEDNHLVTLDWLPVPVHRIPLSRVNEVLMQYAGITVWDMNTNWFEEVTYVPATQSFYTFTSDAGPGSFVPWFGIEHRNGDAVALWEAPCRSSALPVRLDLIRNGDGWQIVSFGIDGYEAEDTKEEMIDGSRAYLVDRLEHYGYGSDGVQYDVLYDRIGRRAYLFAASDRGFVICKYSSMRCVDHGEGNPFAEYMDGTKVYEEASHYRVYLSDESYVYIIRDQ